VESLEEALAELEGQIDMLFAIAFSCIQLRFANIRA
jgi:hypothetical protein